MGLQVLWFAVVFSCSLLCAGATDKRKFPGPEEQPDVNKVGFKAVIDWTKKRIGTAKKEFDATGRKRQRSPENWDDEMVYYVMVDRFANGDLANDATNMPVYQVEEMKNGEPFVVGQWRHGGDLEGLRGRLGYLQNLGVSVIWVSPIFLQNNGMPWGYYMSDPSMIDPGFGSAELFRELVHEAHERGMYVVLDVVTNMLTSVDFKFADAPSIDKVTDCVYAAEDAYWNTSMFKESNLTNRSKFSWGTQMPPYLRNETFFQGCGSVSLYRPEGQKWKDMPKTYNDSRATLFEAGLLWPENFHAPGDMPDFNTMNPTWQKLYTNLLKYWVAYADIDGLRLDAAKYVSADYVAYVSTHVRAFAMSLGKTNFFLTGEILSPGDVPFLYLYLGNGPPKVSESASCSAHEGCLGLAGDCCPNPMGFLACCYENVKKATPVPKRVHEMFQELSTLADEMPFGPGLPTFYPTDDHSYLREVATGEFNATHWWDSAAWQESMTNIQDIMEAQANPYWSWQIIESQDITRLLQEKGQGADVWRLMPAVTWSFTWTGMPTLYYGVEQGFNGQCYKFSNGDQESIVSDSIVSDARESLKDLCADGTDDALKRQDMFTGGPWLLGSAIPSVQKHATIVGRMPEARPPSWCQEPVLDRENEIYIHVRALSRIRKSCPILGSMRPERAATAVDKPELMAYWKFRRPNVTSGPAAALVVLNFSPNPISLPALSVPEDSEISSIKKFVDLLDPKRTAKIVPAKTLLGGPKFVVDPGPLIAHSAIFVSAADAEADGGDATWQVCKAGASRLPPFPEAKECNSTFLWISSLGMILFASCVVVVFVKNLSNNGIFLMIVREPSPVDVLESPPAANGMEDPKHIFCVAIEHTIPDRKVKVSAGGLGKVLDQMLVEHPPGKLSLVHPKFANVDYGELTPFVTLEVTVDMQKQSVNVFTYESNYKDIERTWYLLEHKWFETQISKDAPYPYPQTKLSVLRFFSLWNQAAAQLMCILKPDVYHCMDYHAAMVSLYMPSTEQIPTIIVLHNADYDGAIETDFISDVFWQGVPALRRLSLIFNLDTEAIRKYLTFEGRFNMLWGGIASIEENQGGHGICTVSGKYAAELKRERTMFKGLPAVLPLDNAIDSAADDGPKNVEELKASRAISKKALQEFCELTVDPQAKILIFVGRWVKQKGVDHIALMASRILDENPEVQFVLAGPPGDPYGSYAQELLRPLADQYPGRLFVVTRFFMIPKEARAGAHLCLMPSCSEPFGYVDVEFGLLGVPSLGCAIGGLGKMPGVYFRQQNSDSQDMLLAGFCASVQYALRMREKDYWTMALACIPAQFPFATWRANLKVIYRHAMINFDREALASRDEQLTLGDETGFNVLMEHPTKREGYHGISRESSRSAKGPAQSAKVQHQLQRMQVTEATEFLTQPVSEQRVKELMSFWMATEGRETDAETLQSHISLGDQRMNEKSFATRGLMRPCRGFQRLLGGSCLRIHSVIALGYIISPIMDARLLFLSDNAKSLAVHYDYEVLSRSASNIGSVFGCFLWLKLSKQIPANLLMAVTLFLNQLFFSLAASFLGFNHAFLIVLFDFICGILTTARWLFLIWNYNEDFHGGFQVGTRRVALVESLRQALAGILTVRYPLPAGLASTLFSTLVLSLIILIMLAPSCYSSYVLPATNFWREVKDHKVYLLFIASMSLNGLGVAAWGNTETWLKMNGWVPAEICGIKMVQSVLLIVVLFAVFLSLHRMSIWGPWVMRDFSCLLPPGSLLFSLAFWELGDLHYRSYTFVAAITVAWIIDVARMAAFWTSILTTLANKWYALIGAFVGFGVIKACQALSPIICHLVAWPWGVSPVWSGLIPHHPETNVSTLQTATMCSVWPLAILAYIAQLMAWKYFNQEVLTYKGHGNMMPDGTQGWAASETAYMAAGALKSRPVVDEDNDFGDSEGSYDSDATESDEAADHS